MKARLISALIVGAGVFLGAAQAQQTPAPESRPAADYAALLAQAAQGGSAEVETGRLAVERAGSDEVKRFGKRMVDDHGKVNQELAELLTKKGIAVPKDPDPDHRALIADLAKRSGADFDRNYLREQVLDHEAAVTLFIRLAKEGSDEDLQKFASKMLSTLRQHLDMAKELALKHPGI